MYSKIAIAKPGCTSGGSHSGSQELEFQEVQQICIYFYIIHQVISVCSQIRENLCEDLHKMTGKPTGWMKV